MVFSTITDIINSFGGFISMIFLPILFARSNKRKNDAEAKAAEINNAVNIGIEWKNLYEQSNKTVLEKDSKIDELYAEISNLRDQLAQSKETISELRIEKQALEYKKCNIHGCPKRTPPSDY